MPICEDCGCDTGKAPNSRLCENCKLERDRKYKKEWRENNVSKARESYDRWYAEHLKAPPWVNIKCEICGSIFEARTKKSKLCEYCKKEKKRERTREWKRKNPERVLEQKRRSRGRG